MKEYSIVEWFQYNQNRLFHILIIPTLKHFDNTKHKFIHSHRLKKADYREKAFIIL